MVNNIEGYILELKINTLDDVTRLIDIMKKAGFADFSINPRRRISGIEVDEWRKKKIGRYKNFTLASLDYAKAVDEKSALTVEQILETGLRNLPTRLNVTPDNEGIARRTINVLAKVTLADKYDFVKYTKTEPKKFWLTAKGEQAVNKGIVKDES